LLPGDNPFVPKITKGLKAMLRSRSVGFGLASMKVSRPGLQSLRWRGRDIFYRAGSDDTAIIENLLLKSPLRREYWVPQCIQPRVILDCGANIGIASVYFKSLWPTATIYALEPFKENFDLLKKNTASFNDVHCLNIAAGSQNGRGTLLAGPQEQMTGSMTLDSRYSSSEAKPLAEVSVKRLDSLAGELGIPGFDLIKLDTEGSEFAILQSLDPASLKQTRWVVGELHGVDDWKLLDLLETAGFTIGLKKRLQKRHSVFHACNRTILPQVVKDHQEDLRFLCK
jgi:FkbM family methyltransferase